MNRFFAWLCGLAALGAGFAGAAEPAKDQAALQHPTVFLTPADIQLAKTNIARFEWAHQTADTIQRQAEAWLARPDDWFLRNLPSPGRRASPTASPGARSARTGWGTWGGVQGVFDQPGRVTAFMATPCPTRSIPTPAPATSAADKTHPLFRRSYNAWVVENPHLPKAADNLGLCLHADPPTNASPPKAALILECSRGHLSELRQGALGLSVPPAQRDALTARGIRSPACWSITVDQYDQIFASPALDAPSVKRG